MNAGRQYASVPEEDEEEEEEEEEGEPHTRGRYAGFGIKRMTANKSGLDDYQRALWNWVNVEDLDGFLQEVYAYYKGKGIYCIALARVLNLLWVF